MSLVLHYAPGACSLVPHIALEESGAKFEARRIDFSKKENLSKAFLEINPTGRVPALLTKDGPITEVAAIVNYISEVKGGPGSVPTRGAHVRAQTQEMLGWCASSVHISFALMFRPERFSPGSKQAATVAGRKALAEHFARIETMTKGSGWLVGRGFTAADSYMAVFFRWAKRIGVKVDHYPNWAAHADKVVRRRAVTRVLEREGLRADEFRIS